MSLSFDEDLGKQERSERDNKAKNKKSKKRKDLDEPKAENDRKKTRKEMMSKAREEVCISSSDFKYLVWLICYNYFYNWRLFQVSADFKAASFAQDPQERRRMQSQTLSAVFQTYFRILKHAVQPV